MLCPNTARPGRSIWDIVNRRTFESHVDALSHTNTVPEPSILARKDWPKQLKDGALDFGTVLQLSDDFAFIAACDYGVGYVTVATVQQAQDGEYFLRLAANEGVSDRVKSTLLELLQILKDCAIKELARKRCAEQSFDIIVDLNKNRIFGRLESRHFRRPVYDRGSSRNALTVRLKELLARAAVRTSIHKTQLATLSLEVDELHESFVRLENSRPEELIHAVKAVVKNTYQITVDGISLPRRFGEIGLSTADSREIREVNKIANYWRICLTLAHLSRSFRDLFGRLRLETLEPYMPLHEIGQRRYVHAEIQMIVYYETSSATDWPLVLGSSKEACYLCDSFIKAHGSFYVSKAHRQVFHQWTVPDLVAYNDATLHRFRTALSAVDRAVLKDLQDARHHRLFRQHPLQSSINLHKIVLPTPSLTTILSNTGTECGSVPTISIKTPELLDQLDGARSSSPASETGMESGRAVIESEAILPYSALSGLTTISVTPRSPQHVRLSSLNLQFCLDEQASTITTIYSSRAIVSWKTFKKQINAKEDTECQWFDIEDIPLGGEIILTAPVSKEGNLEFILAARSGDPIRVRCLWHKALHTNQ
ncbi:hypothetical protein EJ08DRAFT_20649 [Tothia fuscella]|uniref:Uncharacterized protein n=1 Tax=Tothia fuscella TaxID=1048955 RepID=A0A9P4U0V6_9PEZI|nr:hypothetical protein EJ08DRAFT_20649 [Tothia fuscella]